MVNAQGWLDNNYPENQRNEITELNISEKNLIGSLNLNGFVNSKEIDCFRNQLSSLTITNCPNLKIIYCSENQLTKLIISNCCSLTELYCSGNQLTDLTIFSKLMNCQWLDLDNNPWNGSLTALQDLSQLTVLRLEGTNIREGLEYLPTSLKKIYCNGSLAKRLVNYSEWYYNDQYNYQAWRKVYLTKKRIKELEEMLFNEFHNPRSLINREIVFLSNNTQWSIETIRELEEEIRKIALPPKQYLFLINTFIINENEHLTVKPFLLLW